MDKNRKPLSKEEFLAQSNPLLSKAEFMALPISEFALTPHPDDPDAVLLPDGTKWVPRDQTCPTCMGRKTCERCKNENSK